MDALNVVEKLTKEIIKHFRLPYKICFPFIKKVLSWVYVAGWEEGMKQSQHRKPVMQLDQFGNVIKIHNSIKSAASFIDTDRSNISKVVKGKQHLAGGYKWRMVSNPEEMKEILEGWQNEL